MRKLAGYTKLPFEGMVVGRSKFALFIQTLIDRLVGSGSIAYAPIIAELKEQYVEMYAEIVMHEENLNLQMVQTRTVNRLRKAFASKIDDVDSAVRYKFRKDSAQFHEVFPHGITQFKRAALKDTQTVMGLIVAFCLKYESQLGADLKAEVSVLKDTFNAERDKQLQIMGMVKSIIPGYKEKKAKMIKLLYKTMLVILHENIDNPEAMLTFFDEQMIWPKRKKKNIMINEDEDYEEAPESITVGPGQRQVADISFDADDTIIISLVEGERVQYYFAVSASESPPASPENMVLDEEHEIQCRSICAPGKKLLIIINNGNVAATVEVFLE